MWGSCFARPFYSSNVNHVVCYWQPSPISKQIQATQFEESTLSSLAGPLPPSRLTTPPPTPPSPSPHTPHHKLPLLIPHRPPLPHQAPPRILTKRKPPPLHHARHLLLGRSRNPTDVLAPPENHVQIHPVVRPRCACDSRDVGVGVEESSVLPVGEVPVHIRWGGGIGSGSEGCAVRGGAGE